MAGADKTPAGLTRAVAHPERLRILRALASRGEPCEPSGLSTELGLPPRVTAYHVEVLHTMGALEAYDADDDAGTWQS